MSKFRLPNTSYDALRAEVKKESGMPVLPKAAKTDPARDVRTPALPYQSETAAQAPADSAPESRPLAPAPGTRKQALPKPAAAPATGTIRVRMDFTAPARGIYPYYDLITDTTPPQAAVPALLSRALDEIEAAVLRGDDIAHEDYHAEAKGVRISTSRSMAPDVLHRLRAALDPHDFLQPSALGKRIATAALALHLRRRSQQDG